MARKEGARRGGGGGSAAEVGCLAAAPRPEVSRYGGQRLDGWNRQFLSAFHVTDSDMMGNFKTPSAALSNPCYGRARA